MKEPIIVPQYETPGSPLQVHPIAYTVDMNNGCAISRSSASK